MTYIRFFLSICALSAYLTPAAEAADSCGIENRVVISCKIEDRDNRLTICLKKGQPDPTIAYQYGTTDEYGHLKDIDLYLERDIREVHFGDLGGKGQDLTNFLSFERGNYLYHVVMTLRNFAEATPQDLSARIFVLEGPQIISKLSCEDGRSGQDGWGLVGQQIFAMGYKWCGGFGSYDFDEMRDLNCVTMERTTDVVSGKVIKPRAKHPSFEALKDFSYLDQ